MADTTPGPSGSGWTIPTSVPAGPAPGYVYVGFWRRFGAFLIDWLILGVPAWIALGVIVGSSFATIDFRQFSRGQSFTTDPATGRLIPNPAVFAAMTAEFNEMFRWILLVGLVLGLIDAIYHAALWSTRGATIGQLLLGIQVRSERDGARIGFWRACLRYLGYLVSGWVLYIGFMWIAVDRRKQGWHDKIAGTVVVRRIT